MRNFKPIFWKELHARPHLHFCPFLSQITHVFCPPFGRVFADFHQRFSILYPLAILYPMFHLILKVHRFLTTRGGEELGSFFYPRWIEGSNTQGKSLSKNLYQAYDVQVLLRIVDLLACWKWHVCVNFPPKKKRHVCTHASHTSANLGHPSRGSRVSTKKTHRCKGCHWLTSRR